MLHKLRELLSPGSVNRSTHSLPHESKRQWLTQREAYIGAQLFGELPSNRQRQFFMLDKHTWVWFEGWTDTHGQHNVTTRYELRGHQVFKIQNNDPAITIHGQELSNFYEAVRKYYYEVADKVYGRPIQA